MDGHSLAQKVCPAPQLSLVGTVVSLPQWTGRLEVVCVPRCNLLRSTTLCSGYLRLKTRWNFPLRICLSNFPVICIFGLCNSPSQQKAPFIYTFLFLLQNSIWYFYFPALALKKEQGDDLLSPRQLFLPDLQHFLAHIFLFHASLRSPIAFTHYLVLFSVPLFESHVNLG